MSQVELETWLRAGVLLALGLVIRGAERLSVKASPE
jgi:uncharacterized membrane protein YfhO